VGLAIDAAGLLADEGIKAAVVSMPGVELFLGQDKAYRDSVLGTAPRIAIEAGIEMGWHRVLRHKDAFVGLSDFGASAPAGALFEHFGLTAKRAAEVARGLVKRT
jgi:transketolase